MKAAAIRFARVLSTLAPSAVAGKVEQYGVYLLPPRGDGAHRHALIVDTTNGYV